MRAASVSMSSPPSLVYQLAVALILLLGSFRIGYELGSFTTTRSKPRAGIPTPSLDYVAPEPLPETIEVTEDLLEEESTEGIPDGDLSAVSAQLFEPCKMVFVVRTDLKLTPGKIATQCAQATLACYKALSQKNPKLVHHWEYTGQAKIALKAKSKGKLQESELLELEAIAKSLNLCARSIQDPGLGGNMQTILAIGPAPVNLINEVTGKLRLL